MVEKYKLQQDDINSMNLTSDTLARLKQILPEVFTEGTDGKPSIDVEKLKIALGGEVDIEADNQNRYSFNWSGKKQAQALANQPSTATLRPSMEDSKNWPNTQNVYIEGDNLEVLKLLQKSYYNSIKMIYIDPPYNTGKDFVYKDNFHDNVKNYLQLTGQVDDEGNRISTNTDKSGRYHTDWLNMMYPRLKLARNLLKDDGVIFISIDDNEVHNLRKICDEIFGEDNFIGELIWKRRSSSALADNNVSSDHEYVISYKRNSQLFFSGIAKDFKSYSNPDNDPRGAWVAGDLTVGMTASMRPNQAYDLINPKTGDVFQHNPNRVWAYIPESMDKLIADGRILFPDDISKRPMLKRFQSELKSTVNPLSSLLQDFVGLNTEATKLMQDIMGGSIFEYSKPLSLLNILLEQVSSKNDIILDFFSGSATTAHAVMQLNAEDGGKRKYICVQLPEATDGSSEAYKAGYKNICEIGKERIRRAGEKVLTEWQEKQAKNDLLAEDSKSTVPPDIGFKVFKLDTSNFKPFDGNFFSEEMILSGRSSLDLFYELVLKQGYSLDYKQRIVDIGGTSCYALVHDDDTPFVLAVLDDQVKNNFALELLKYALRLVIVKDDCFATDEIKLNTLATLEQLQSKDDPLQIRIV